MTLVSGLSWRISARRRKALLGAVGIGRQAKVERHDRGFVHPQRFDRRWRDRPATDDAVTVIGPFELALQALVILDDEQHGEVVACRSCAFPLRFARPDRRRGA